MDNNTDITLEGQVATWNMKPTTGDLGGTYTGTFKFRCFLSPLQQLEAGREYREYLGNHAVLAEDIEAKLAGALSQLKQRVVKAPPFWTSSLQDSQVAGNIGDLNIIGLVLDAALRSEAIYLERIQKERDDLLERTIKAGEETLHKKVER